VRRGEVLTEAQEGKASRLWRREGFKTLKSTCKPRAEAASRLTPRRVCRGEREGDEKVW